MHTRRVLVFMYDSIGMCEGVRDMQERERELSKIRVINDFIARWAMRIFTEGVLFIVRRFVVH